MASAGSAQTHFHKSEDFESVERAEWLDWDRHKSPDGESSEKLIGLALSGGGIRSASFALGVMQALYSFHAFDKFNYLSTVSGGGYIGGALTYLRNTLAAPGAKWFHWGPSAARSDQGQDHGRAHRGAEQRRQRAGAEDRRLSTATRQLHDAEPRIWPPGPRRRRLAWLRVNVLPYFAILSGFLAFWCGSGFSINRQRGKSFGTSPSGLLATRPKPSPRPRIVRRVLPRSSSAWPSYLRRRTTARRKPATSLAKCLSASCAEPREKGFFVLSGLHTGHPGRSGGNRPAIRFSVVECVCRNLSLNARRRQQAGSGIQDIDRFL